MDGHGHSDACLHQESSLDRSILFGDWGRRSGPFSGSTMGSSNCWRKMFQPGGWRSGGLPWGRPRAPAALGHVPSGGCCLAPGCSGPGTHRKAPGRCRTRGLADERQDTLTLELGGAENARLAWTLPTANGLQSGLTMTTAPSGKTASLSSGSTPTPCCHEYSRSFL